MTGSEEGFPQLSSSAPGAPPAVDLARPICTPFGRRREAGDFPPSQISLPSTPRRERGPVLGCKAGSGGSTHARPALPRAASIAADVPPPTSIGVKHGTDKFRRHELEHLDRHHFIHTRRWDLDGRRRRDDREHRLLCSRKHQSCARHPDQQRQHSVRRICRCPI